MGRPGTAAASGETRAAGADASLRVLCVGNMYPPHHEGGYELIWQATVGRLRARGHRVTVLTTEHRREGVADGAEADVVRALRWYWRDHEFPRLAPRSRLELERYNLGVLERQLAELEPDVVSWWAMGGMSLGLIELVRRRGRPAVGVVIDDWLSYGPRVDQWQRMARRLGPARVPLGALTGAPTSIDYAGAATWLFCSRFTRERAQASHSELTGDVVTPGVDPSLGPVRDPPPWRWRLLYYGRIDPRKGVATAIEALVELESATLRIVGSGEREHTAELKALAERLGIADRVSFEDQVPRAQLADLIADSDAVVFPVVWEEPWGLVPLEAMTVGRPVVATGRGGSGEYLRDGENCLLFDASDPSGLAARLTRLAGDEPLRERLRAQGARTAAGHTEDAFDDGVEAALLEAADRAR